MIAFIGITGSGKTTQAEILAKRIGCPVVTTGKVLRKYLTGVAADDVLAGKLIDDRATLPLLEKELSKLRADRQEVVLDGSPRSMAQADWLVKKFKSGEIKFTAFIHLKAAEAVVQKRLEKRNRNDDTKESIKTRFAEYHNRIEPILGYLRDQGFKIHEIDGEGPVEADAAAIAKALKL